MKFRSTPMQITCLVLGVLAGGTVEAQTESPPSTAEAVAADPAGAWERFLAQAELAEAYSAYDALPEVGYGADGVDPERCRKHARALAEAVARIPVSIALRHAAMLCADALEEEAWAERELAALAALSNLALGQASHIDDDRPIRVLAPVDIYALLRASGLEFLYEYYEHLSVRRYYPLNVAAWDADTATERHFSFDFVDATDAINRNDAYSGFPIQRSALADNFLKALAESGDVPAIDILAVRAAAAKAEPTAKLAALKPAAQRGGIQAMRFWIGLCVRQPFPGCSDGLVDTLLPQAEKLHAMPMTLLAFAYGEGIGIESDPRTAERLLQAANMRWTQDAATVAYADLWVSAHEDPIPAALQARLDKAEQLGNRNARMFAIAHQMDLDDESALDAAELAFLAQPPANKTGAGYGVLAEYYQAREDKAQAAEWTRRAALAGHVWHQAMHAYNLRYGDAAAAADDAEVQRLLIAAAHGGDAWAARLLAYDSMDDGRWQDAGKWLLDPVGRGDIESILMFAQLHEEEHPDLPAQTEQSIGIYRALADDNDDAEARRRLADMALDGRGMEKNPQQAREWLRVDAEKDDHESGTLLGIGYLRGDFGEVDETEALRWLEPAIEAKYADAILEYGSWLYYVKKTPQSRQQALDLWQRGVVEKHLWVANNLAWALCTAPDETIHDVGRGLAIALEMDKVHELGAAQVDTVAACHAAGGDFESAASTQQSAMDLLAAIEVAQGDAAAKADIDETMQGFRDRLALYRAGKSYVEYDDEQSGTGASAAGGGRQVSPIR